MLVSQDMIRLVGFASALERDWFRLLQIGAGGRHARWRWPFSPPSRLHELANAIALQDKAMIGARQWRRQETGGAHRAGTEGQGAGFAAADAALAKLQAELDAPQPTAAADAVSALVNLGYGQTQAGAAVAAAMRKAGDDQPTEKLIRLALKELALA